MLCWTDAFRKVTFVGDEASLVWVQVSKLPAWVFDKNLGVIFAPLYSGIRKEYDKFISEALLKVSGVCNILYDCFVKVMCDNIIFLDKFRETK